ncbi:MAG: hypothetical protein WAL56_22260 [Candidatus Sulfotelmatobacter sp.]
MSINAEFPSCAICSKPLTREATVTSDHGLPVHQKCHALVTKVKGVRPDGVHAVRCPYCVDGGNFKLMNARADGEWFLCPGCGHATMPGHSSYRCNCGRCTALA